MERRIRRLGVFMVLCFVALFVQLNNIQIFKANALATSPDNPRVIAAARDQPRGSILAADGTVLAQSVPAKGYYQRVYPEATASLFANVVGMESPIYGNTGVEDEYNAYLTSHTRQATSLRDLLTNNTVQDNVTLTMSTKLQQAMATALSSLPASAPASVPTSDTQASAVAIDPKTGAILAMYSTPSFDPNLLVSPNSGTERSAWTANIANPANPMAAKAYQQTNAPGSTFKVVTTSAVYDHDPPLALDDFPQRGCINTTPYTDINNTNQKLCNYGNGQEVCGGTLQQSLPQSCDTAFAQMGIQLGAQSENSEAQAFGFNQAPPLDLPGVAKSNFPSVAKLTNNQAGQAYSAFGQQDVTASALQMALVASAIADHGVIMTPHVMSQIRDTQGNLVKSYTPTPWLTATSASTASQVQSLMQAVVTDPLGTAHGVFPADEAVAAKTGTAQVGTNAQYTSDWMIAYSTKDPNVAVAVVAPYQASNRTGAQISGPVACAILQAALNSTEACPG
jgi:peptidoglycan glycosyltransferase